MSDHQSCFDRITQSEGKNREEDRNIPDYCGRRVMHPQYGKGTVMKEEGNSFSVLFDDGRPHIFGRNVFPEQFSLLDEPSMFDDWNRLEADAVHHTAGAVIYLLEVPDRAEEMIRMYEEDEITDVEKVTEYRTESHYFRIGPNARPGTRIWFGLRRDANDKIRKTIAGLRKKAYCPPECLELAEEISRSCQKYAGTLFASGMILSSPELSDARTCIAFAGKIRLLEQPADLFSAEQSVILRKNVPATPLSQREEKYIGRLCGENRDDV